MVRCSSIIFGSSGFWFFKFINKAEAPKKEKAVEEVTTLDKKVADGAEYFAVAHIFASFNDTFVVIFLLAN